MSKKSKDKKIDAPNNNNNKLTMPNTDSASTNPSLPDAKHEKEIKAVPDAFSKESAKKVTNQPSSTVNAGPITADATSSLVRDIILCSMCMF